MSVKAHYFQFLKLCIFQSGRDINWNSENSQSFLTQQNVAIIRVPEMESSLETKIRTDMTLVIHRATGETLQVPVTSRLDTAEEVLIYEAGGVLQRFAQDFLEGAVA